MEPVVGRRRPAGCGYPSSVENAPAFRQRPRPTARHLASRRTWRLARTGCVSFRSRSHCGGRITCHSDARARNQTYPRSQGQGSSGWVSGSLCARAHRQRARRSILAGARGRGVGAWRLSITSADSSARAAADCAVSPGTHCGGGCNSGVRRDGAFRRRSDFGRRAFRP